MMMTAANADKPPPIELEDRDNLADFHSASVALARRQIRTGSLPLKPLRR